MTTLASKICDEIQIAGSISFARFMELALYSPELGYYECQKHIGQRGDFYTSVSVGSLFGDLLAFQFAEWFEANGAAHLQIVETGAHGGQLACDILSGLKKFRPKIFERVAYCILEPSERHRCWQRKTLADYADKLSWWAGLSDFPRSAFCVPRFDIFFSNEFFDAMPVHRLGWDAKEKRWFEWGVGWSGESFIWKRLPEIRQNFLGPQIAPELLAILPDEFTTEVCPAAAEWWAKAAQIVDNGKLIAIDYGLLAEDFFVPERSSGTLRAFFQHHASSDLLARPGQQDLTAHVNFSALQSAGEIDGLKTETLVSQTKFFTAIAQQSWAKPKMFAEWNENRRRQFQTLTHPEHLGRNFRVLIQSR